MITIRGAITIDKNEAEEIFAATNKLLTNIFEKNDLQIENIVYVLFTCTKDIDKAYPAVEARKMGLTDAALMCMQEMHVEGSLPMCIRVMVAVNSDKAQKLACHCYMKNAEALRPDLKFYSVAIDGPTASGKSSVSREAAKILGFKHVETGAMYRAVALHCMRNGKSEEQEIIDELDKFQLEVELSDEGQRTFLDGEDVTDEIRNENVSAMSSIVASINQVREKLLPLQRKLAAHQNIIMDGRDIQTVVLPDATVKIFITATIDERTKRRCIDIEKAGKETNFETVKKQIIERDNSDTSRAHAPLCKAETAELLDTTEINFSDTVSRVVDIINEKIGENR